MLQPVVPPGREVAGSVDDRRDSKRIAELIKQLDRDLAETQENSFKRQ
jgi:hypothetical protein